MKDIKYIIKRIIIGVGIALALMFIRGNILIGVQAKELSSTNWGYQYQGIDTNTSASQFNITGNPWANWRLGTLYFSVAVTKSAGSATDPVLGVRAIHAISDTTVYTCYFGANTSANSTWTESTYSVQCPMDLGWPGVTRIDIIFNPISQQTASQYIVTLDTFATFEQDDSVSVNVDTSSTTTAINSQITNDNTNTTNIINNQNQNTQQQIESQKVCKNIVTSWTRLTYQVVFNSDTLYKYPISPGTYTIKWDESLNASSQPALFYYREGSTTNYPVSNGQTIEFDSNWILFVARAGGVSALTDNFLNSVQIINCRNGNQAIADSQQQINDTLNNDNVDGATSEATDFFNDFQSNSHGLSGIITAPLRLINALTTAQCTPLQFQLPFVHDQVTLPCMRGIYETYFGVFFSLYQLITTGLICYATLINLYSKIHNLQNPKNDRIEVLNL